MTAVPFSAAGSCGAVISHFNITERRRAADELASSEECYRRLFEMESTLNLKQQNLAEHLNTAVEQERLAISRDIHDDLGQNLTIMNLDIEWLRKNIPTDGGKTD